MASLAMTLAKGVKKGPPMASEGSDEEEAAEPADEAAAEGDDAEMGDYDSIEDSSVSELMSTKDPKTFKSALRDFVRACIDRGDEGDSGE